MLLCISDDFCKAYEEYCKNKLLMDKEEVVPFMYHLSGYKNFKWYCTRHIMIHQWKDYPDIVSYKRFVEIIKFALVPLILYTIKARSGKCARISFIDSTPLKVICYNKNLLIFIIISLLCNACWQLLADV